MTPTEFITALNPVMGTDPALSVYLLMAEGTTCRGYFQNAQNNADLAVALRAMHIWVLAQRPLAEAGAISNKTEGQLSVGFVSTALQKGINSAYLSQTQWGLQLLDLIKQQGPVASIVRATPAPGEYISPQSLTDIAMQLLQYS